MTTATRDTTATRAQNTAPECCGRAYGPDGQYTGACHCPGCTCTCARCVFCGTCGLVN